MSAGAFVQGVQVSDKRQLASFRIDGGVSA
jgi:hypothetical protein